jgi:hypothetical protein
VEHALACPGSSRASGSAVNWRRYAEKDGTWERQWRWHRKAVRALWAPELHYVKRLKNYFITLSMPPGDRGILKSTTGKPEGPYVNALANDGKLDGDIDAFFFEDDDGTVYLVSGGGTDYFQDKQGNWWDCFFGNDNQAPFREKPAISIWTLTRSGGLPGALRFWMVPGGRRRVPGASAAERRWRCRSARNHGTGEVRG